MDSQSQSEATKGAGDMADGHFSGHQKGGLRDYLSGAFTSVWL